MKRQPVEAAPGELPAFRTKQEAADYVELVQASVEYAERQYQDAIARGVCPWTNKPGAQR